MYKINKKVIILFIATIVTILSISCSGNASKQKVKESKKIEKTYKYASIKDGILHLDLNKARKHPKELKLSEICDSVIYIPLETKKECLLSECINRIVIDGEDVFIQDGWKLFHFNGNFLGQLGKTGRGPGEYICADVFVDKKSKHVFAKANYRNCLFCFNYAGEFMNNNITVKGNHQMLFNSVKKDIYMVHSYDLLTSSPVNKDYAFLSVLNLEKNKIHRINSNYYPMKYGNKKSDYNVNYVANKCYLFNNELRIQEVSNDTIFSYKDKNLLPYIILNNGEYKPKLTYDLFYDLNKKFIKNKGRLNRANYSRDIAKLYNPVLGESERYVFVGYNEQYIYDKKEHELMCFDDLKGEKKAIINDLDGVFDFSSYSIINNSMILLKMDADSFINKVKSSNNSNERLNAIAKNITEESNYVLVIGKLKK